MLVVLLVFAVTALTSDMTIPDAVRIRNAGHPAVASVLSLVPLLAFVFSVIVLPPRARNDSGHATLRTIGKLPLLIRYILLVTLFYAIAEAIKRLAS